jgi:transcriptional regulator with XRE-family HTH domain
MAQKSGIVAVLAENVRRLRKAAELSQERLGLEAGLDRTYISQVERRQRNVTIEVLARLAKALGTTAKQLLIPPRKTKTGGKD